MKRKVYVPRAKVEEAAAILKITPEELVRGTRWQAERLGFDLEVVEGYPETPEGEPVFLVSDPNIHLYGQVEDRCARCRCRLFRSADKPDHFQVICLPCWRKESVLS